MGDSILDQQTLDIPCPKCGKKTKKPVGWIRRNKKFPCICGEVITLDADQFIREVKKVDKTIDDFKRQIALLNKSLKF